jgi:hypothetical protein
MPSSRHPPRYLALALSRALSLSFPRSYVPTSLVATPMLPNERAGVVGLKLARARSNSKIVHGEGPFSNHVLSFNDIATLRVGMRLPAT